LSELGKFYRGHTYSAKNVKSNGLLVLRSTNIQKGKLVLHKDLVFVDKECKEDILLRNGDLVLCMANGSKRLVGKSAKYFGEDRKDVTIGAFCSIYRSENMLISYVFESYLYNKYLQITLAGSTINNLKNSELEKFAFPFPNDIEEQQKIAAILSTVDEQISTTDKIIEKSKELKKGLMQKLFSEGIGHTEFKDTKIGRIPKDWEVVKLVDLIKLSSGKGLSKKNMIDGNIPVYGGNGISGYHNDYFIEDPTIVIGRVGEYCGSIHLLNENCWITDNGLYVTKFLSEVNLGFLAPLFQIMNFNSYSKVGGQPSISQTTVTNLSIPFPPLPEQQKIAAILSTVDAKIEKEQTQKAQLEALKKGLMQQLLTGKKRVTV
jgi:type I restriction enzyme S subunit